MRSKVVIFLAGFLVIFFLGNRVLDSYQFSQQAELKIKAMELQSGSRCREI